MDKYVKFFDKYCNCINPEGEKVEGETDIPKDINPAVIPWLEFLGYSKEQ